MNGLPVVRPRQLIHALERAGFFVHHIRGSHHYLRHSAKPGLLVTVPYHNWDLKRGTLRSILRQAGITPEELSDLLQVSRSRLNSHRQLTSLGAVHGIWVPRLALTGNHISGREAGVALNQ